MATFPSPEWARLFADRLRAHPDAPALARALDGTYRFVVQPGGSVPAPASFDLEIRPAGDGADVRVLDAPAADPRLVISADLRRWRDLIEGRLDIVVAFLLRRIRVEGDITSVRGALGDAGPLLECLRSVPTTWPG